MNDPCRAARIETYSVETEAASLWQLMNQQRDQPLTADKVTTYRTRALSIRQALDRLDKHIDQMEP